MTTPAQASPAALRQQKTQLALYALLGGVVAIGFVPIFVRLSQVGPSATAFWRMALSLPVFWAWMSFERRKQPTARRPIGRAETLRLLLPGLLFAADLAVWHWSIRLTSVANSTLLANFAPVFVALGGWLIYGQRVNLRFVVGMGTAVAGTILLVGSSFTLSSEHLLGDALGLVAAVFYASYILSIKRLREEFSTATIMTFNSLAACAVLLPLALLSGETLIPPTPAGWLVLLALALISHTGGQGLITYALAILPAAFSSVVLLFQPVEATFLAFLILNEPLGALQALGGALVLTGIYLARRASQ